MEIDATVVLKMDEIKQKINNITSFLKQKKVMNIICIVVLLALIIGGSYIRFQNLPLLKDSTSGKYIPMALDPFYFLRVAETMLEGPLPEIDVMRYPALSVSYTNEILPLANVVMYKLVHIINSDVTIQFIVIISPVIFFILGLITFFFLVCVLTKSRGIALISSIILTIIPTYLHRTMPGFSDHEAIGIFAFFAVMLCYALFLKFLDKRTNVSTGKNILWGLLVGFFTAFTLASWGGVSNFIFIIIPLSMLAFWLINEKNMDKKFRFNFLIFYFVWFASSVLFGMMYGFSLYDVLYRALLAVWAMVNGGILLFLIVDYMFQLKKEKILRYRLVFSTLIAAVLGVIFLFFNGINVFSFIPHVIWSLLHPFGAERIGLTVAENIQPYLVNWMNQIGNVFFWMFYTALMVLGIEVSKCVGKTKNKVLFLITWIIMISGILFSRISPTSILDGTTFISQFIYFGSLLLFFGCCIWLYFHDEIKIKSTLLLTVSLTIVMLIAGRGAIRLFFVVTAFVCFIVGYAIVSLFKYVRKSNDSLLKLFLFIVAGAMVVGLILSFFIFVTTINQQAKYMGPSANYQWQNAMSWVRDNTKEGSIFVHWWDYGYWVQYLAKRPTVTDGGHASGYWDHLIGRYVLTTPKPETALSFMKTHNVSYLLLDPTDIGKYPAYSKIGSDDGGEDRYASIPIMLSDQSQITETRDGITFVYTGVFSVDEDIVYNEGNISIFLPANAAAVIGIILEMNNDTLLQPKGVFFYNDVQTILPIRYIFIENRLIDFGKGVDVVLRVFPRVIQSEQGIQIDKVGAMVYLSPKVSKGLFAQLYLLNNAFNNYPTIVPVYLQPDPIINELNSQGANLGNLIFFNGLRGGIKIWKINYPENIIINNEFLQTSGEYAEMDNLEFIK